MPETIDELLSEIRALSAEIETLDDDSPRRRKLEKRRLELRSTAQNIADTSRHPDAIARQVEALEARLDEIGALLIKKGYSERSVGKTIQDPGAYSHNINKAIAEDHADEVRSIDAQLARLRAVGSIPTGDTDVEPDEAPRQ